MVTGLSATWFASGGGGCCMFLLRRPRREIVLCPRDSTAACDRRCLRQTVPATSAARDERCPQRELPGDAVLRPCCLRPRLAALSGIAASRRFLATPPATSECRSLSYLERGERDGQQAAFGERQPAAAAAAAAAAGATVWLRYVGRGGGRWSACMRGLFCLGSSS